MDRNYDEVLKANYPEVAPRRGAWIEIVLLPFIRDLVESHPVGVRG